MRPRVIPERLSGCAANPQQEQNANCHVFHVLHVIILSQAAIPITTCPS
jgi:hypothetical protein